MKVTKLLVVFLCMQFSAFAAYELVWEDSFDGNALNQTVWSYETGTGDWGWGNNEAQYYTNRQDNVYVEDGKLHIKAKKENHEGSGYTSGRIITRNKVSAKYGKMEALIKCPPGGQGIWPAFWMLGTGANGAWPYCGEIDIMEMMCTADPATWRRTLSTYHWNNTGGMVGEYSPVNAGSNVSFDEQLGVVYRIYGVEWTPAAMTGYVCDATGNDRRNVFTMGIGDAANVNNGRYAFHHEFFFILNIALGGTYVGGRDNIDPNFTEGTMIVDWVRIYQDRTTYTSSSFTNRSNLVIGDNGGDDGDIPNADKDYWIIYKDDLSEFSNYLDCRSAFAVNAGGAGNLTAAQGNPFEGNNSLSYTTNSNEWYGGEFAVRNYDLRAIEGWNLHVAVKCNSQADVIKFVIKEDDNNEASYVLTPGNYGYTGSGAWEEVVIPLSAFDGMDFTANRASAFLLGFYQGQDNPPTGVHIELDDIYFVNPNPTGGNGNNTGNGNNNNGNGNNNNNGNGDTTPIADEEVLVALYPNPASYYVEIELPSDATVSIFDLSGRMLIQETYPSGKNTISIEQLPNGIYPVKIESEAFTKTMLLRKIE